MDASDKVEIHELISRGGDYHDVVRKTEDGWRFVSRTYVPRWKGEAVG